MLALKSETFDFAKVINQQDIVDSFKRRATRREFPVVKYLVYLRFSELVLGD